VTVDQPEMTQQATEREQAIQGRRNRAQVEVKRGDPPQTQQWTTGEHGMRGVAGQGGLGREGARVDA